MKKIVTTILFTLIVLYSYSQCNTEIDESNEGYLVYHNPEDIYNADNGNQNVENISFFASSSDFYIQNTNQIVESFHIVVRCAVSSESFVPRKIKFHFKNGEIIELMADNMFEPETNFFKTIQVCAFNLKKFDQLRLIIMPMDKIEVIDHRQGVTITCSPFEWLVSEQLDCVGKIFSSYYSNKYGSE